MPVADAARVGFHNERLSVDAGRTIRNRLLETWHADPTMTHPDFANAALDLIRADS